MMIAAFNTVHAKPFSLPSLAANLPRFRRPHSQFSKELSTSPSQSVQSNYQKLRVLLSVTEFVKMASKSMRCAT